LFSGVTSVTVGNPITINGQNIIILGPGATAPNSAGVGAPSASGNLKISGGGTTQIFHVTAGSLAVDGITLTGGVSPATCTGQSGYSCGGAIENYGTLSIVNTVFNANGNTSVNYGGAVYDQSQVNSTTAVAYSTFTGNSGQIGAGYYLEYYANGTGGAAFTHCVFANNTASDGSSYGDGGAIYAAWNLSVDTSTFTGNVAGSSSAGGFIGHGGAIDLAYNSQSPTITNSTFGGTSASAGNFAGGAGANDTGFGGAVANEGNYPLVLGGDTFANNVSRGGYDAEGGAIADFQGVTSAGDTFTSNLADASAGTSGESGYAGGGAVYTDYNSSWTNDTFTSNQAKGGLAVNGAYNGQATGGAIESDDGDPALISVNETAFSNNGASAAYLCAGGAVSTYWESTSSAVPFTNVQFTNNSCSATNNSSYAYAEGGGLFVYYGLISLESITFKNNSVVAHYTPNDTNAEAVALGGGFAYEDGYYYCGDCSYRRHTPRSPAAAAAYAARAASDKTRRAQVLAQLLANRKRNHALPAFIHAHAPMATRRVQQTAPSDGIDSSTFTGDSATAIALDAEAYGGGADISGDATITNSTFSGNSATWSSGGTGGYAGGGGISACTFESNGGSPSITATVSGNTATNAGGGIYNNCSATTILNSTISGNSVTNAQISGQDGGGGINDQGYYLLLSGSTLTANTVSGSTAQTGGGGFLNDDDDDAAILNSTIYKNTSAIDGGGIENLSFGYTTLLNVTVYQNTASGNGGGISNDPAGDGTPSTYVFSANSIVAGNTASGNGSDIWNLDTFTSYGYNLVQQSSNYGSGTSNAPLGSDIIGVGPALASALASNGGPTQTLADTSSSPGKGHIPFAASLCNGASGTSVDQRGYARGAGGVCDIGAYEFNGTATAQSVTAKSLRNSMNFRRNH
jgi:hypothetical protein